MTYDPSLLNLCTTARQRQRHEETKSQVCSETNAQVHKIKCTRREGTYA